MSKQTWLRPSIERALEPDLPIVDAHHHLWGEGSLAKRFGRALPADLAQVMVASGHRILAGVYIECGWGYRESGPTALRCVGETEAVEAALPSAQSINSNRIRIAAAIMGFADLMVGDAVAPVLEAHVVASPRRFRGIRFVTSSDIDEPYGGSRREGFLSAPALRAALRRLDQMGMIFETWCLHNQVDQLLNLADAFPNLTFVLDHLATPIRIGRFAHRTAEVLADWKSAVLQASKRPNIFLKIGGLGMAVAGYQWQACNDPPDSHEIAAAYRPYVCHALETFSPARCMFESNFPVDGASYDYGALWNAFKRLTVDLSADERQAVLSRNAMRLYRIEVLD